MSPVTGQQSEGSPTGVELVLVCGPWSSGTTAVAGMLRRLGMNGLPPFFGTTDERTPNSYESVAFRAAVDEVASEKSVTVTVPPATVVERLTAFRERIRRGEHGAYSGEPIFLKYPLSALLIAPICEVFRTRLVYVLRPLRDVEATRVRRGWGAQTGAQGGQVLYGAMFRTLVEDRIPMPHMVRFVELVEDPRRHALELARFVGLEVGPEKIEEAARFVRGG